jgi:hypothetical protein
LREFLAERYESAVAFWPVRWSRLVGGTLLHLFDNRKCET